MGRYLKVICFKLYRYKAHTNIQRKLVENVCLTTTSEQLHSNMSKNNESPKMISVELEFSLLGKEINILPGAGQQVSPRG